MESSHFSNAEPPDSEKSGKKDGKKTHVVARADVPERFSYDQRAMPRPQREAMGRALLEGVMFERPRAETSDAERSSGETKTKDKKNKSKAAEQPTTRRDSESPIFSPAEMRMPPGMFQETIDTTGTTGEAAKDEAEDKDAPTAKSRPATPMSTNSTPPTAATPPHAERSATESFDDIMRAEGFDSSFVDAVTKEGATPPTEVYEAPSANPAELTSEHAEWKHTPTIPPLEQQSTPDLPPMEQTPLTAAEQARFNELIHQAQMGSVSEQVLAEAAVVTPVAAFEDLPDNDDIFRQQIAREWPNTVVPPRPRFYEQTAGEQPLDAGEATPPMPPVPPTLEGGSFGEGPEWNPLDTNEAALDALAPAGNVLGRGGLPSLTALEAQRRLDNLRHASAETGLATGVVFLGVMLALEHGARKRHDRKQQKQIHTQQKQIKTMGQRLQQEQVAHQQTAASFDQFARRQATTNERFNQATAPQPGQERLGVVPVPTHTGERSPQQVQPLTAEQLAVLGKAPEQTPEEQTASPQLRPGERLVQSEWHNIVVDKKGRTVENAITYGQGFRQEQQQEQIRDRMADDGLTGGKAGGSTHGAMQGGGLYQGMTALPKYSGSPSPLQQLLPSGMTSPSLPPGPPLREDPQHLLAEPKHRAILQSPWTWVLFILLLLAFFGASLIG